MLELILFGAEPLLASVVLLTALVVLQLQATCAEVCPMEFRWHQWPGNALVVVVGIPHCLGTCRIHSLEVLPPSSRPAHMKKLSNMQG